MRQRLTIILTFVVIIGLLVIINTLTHVQDEPTRDLEILANRSTYHSGPTGTRALHDFLSESGYRVMRWREPAGKLLSDSGRQVNTLVVIGETRVPFEDDEFAIMLQWVATGGRLVFIDRSPGAGLLTPDGWTLTTVDGAFPNLDTNPADIRQMTANVSELKPVQPTLLTNNVESVMPSRFASRLAITPVPTPTPSSTPATGMGIGPGVARPAERTVIGMPTPAPEETETEAASPPAEDVPQSTPDESATPTVIPESPEAAATEDDEEPYVQPVAPVVHIRDVEGAVLVDYAYGNGRVILLTDPFIVTNAGVRLKDNLTLAINIVGGPKAQGLIAFDEYHQGRGITQNAFASYFAGTPVLPIAGQIVLLVLVVLWTNGRRFGRPLPLPQVDRRSSLEFVASMAELQERSRAYDLAIENIYSRIRRVLARHAGVDYNSSRTEIAERIAARSAIDRHELETLMRQCEEAINGVPISSRQSISLVRRLREIERDLGLRMRSRDVRQAAENI
jgi:hypothetical protein